MAKIIVANWKMNPKTAKEAIHLFSMVAHAHNPKDLVIVICPPFPYLYLVSHAARENVRLGAQDVFWEPQGAYTGSVSVAMLKDIGVRYVIVGHSERREYMKETDAMVAEKVRAVLRAGLRAILCVGEPLSVRKKGVKAAEAYVESQLKKGLSLLSASSGKDKKVSKSETKQRLSGLVVAYEPVWAISTAPDKQEENSDDALHMIRHIKKLLASQFAFSKPQVLYGGSVDGENIGSFISHPEIDGALVGSASLNPGEFRRIIDVAGQL